MPEVPAVPGGLADRRNESAALRSGVADVFAPGGPLTLALPGFEARGAQREMASAVASVLVEGGVLLAEAGTGTGKTLAYLVPAILEASAGRENRVVVSTHTISLQEQLVHKDIPFLQTVMPQPFVAVLAKGRSNYLSLRRLRVAQQRAGMLLADPGSAHQLQKIGQPEICFHGALEVVI